MSLSHTLKLAILSIAATLPGTALAATIYAGNVLQTSAPIGGSDTLTDFTFSDAAALGNVLGSKDGGGKTLELGAAAFSQTFIEVDMQLDFTLDGTDKRDLKIVNYSTVDNNNTVAAAIWVVLDGVAYNVGSDRIEQDTASGVPGVWDSPTGEGGAGFRETGWVVFGGKKGGKIDLDLFFGSGGIYGERVNPSFSSVFISGYNENGTTINNYDLDAVVAYNEATVVPVPAALWLFLSGLTGLIAFSRKRRA